jgi:hypothetical protein
MTLNTLQQRSKHKERVKEKKGEGENNKKYVTIPTRR